MFLSLIEHLWDCMEQYPVFITRIISDLHTEIDDVGIYYSKNDTPTSAWQTSCKRVWRSSRHVRVSCNYRVWRNFWRLYRINLVTRIFEFIWKCSCILLIIFYHFLLWISCIKLYKICLNQMVSSWCSFLFNFFGTVHTYIQIKL